MAGQKGNTMKAEFGVFIRRNSHFEKMTFAYKEAAYAVFHVLCVAAANPSKMIDEVILIQNGDILESVKF